MTKPKFQKAPAPNAPNMPAVFFSLYALMIPLWSPLDTSCYYFRILVNLSFSHTFTQHCIHSQTMQYCIANVRNVGMQRTKGAAFHIKLSAFCGWRRHHSFPVFIMQFLHMLQTVIDHCASNSTNAQQIINHGAQPGSWKLRSWQSTQLSDPAKARRTKSHMVEHAARYSLLCTV